MMHAELLAQQSKALGVLVHGSMKEAVDMVAEWPDYDPDTFVRFWQFAYTGDYDDPEPTPVENAEPAPAPETADGADSQCTVEERSSFANMPDIWAGVNTTKKSKKKKKVNDFPLVSIWLIDAFIVDGSHPAHRPFPADGSLGGFPVARPHVRPRGLLRYVIMDGFPSFFKRIYRLAITYINLPTQVS